MSPSIMKRYAILLIVLIALIAAPVSALSLQLSPGAVRPGEEVGVGVTVTGLANGSEVDIAFIATWPAATTTQGFNITNISLPFSLQESRVSAGGENLNGIHLTTRSGGDTWIRESAGVGTVAVSDLRECCNGSYDLMQVSGGAWKKGEPITLRMAVAGRKEGAEDGQIAFTVPGSGLENVLVVITVNGTVELSKRIDITWPLTTPLPTTSRPGSVSTLSGLPGAVTYRIGITGVEIDTSEADPVVTIDRLKVRGTGYQVAVTENQISLSQGNLFINISAEGITETSGIIAGKLKRIHVAGGPQSAQVSFGRIDAVFEADLPDIPPDSALIVSIQETVPPDASLAISRAGDQKQLDITAVACIVQIGRSNLEKMGQSAIRVKIPSSWVEQHGGVGAVKVVRISDANQTSILETVYAGISPDGNLIFEALSPEGLSSFAAVSVKARPAPPSPFGGAQPLENAEVVMEEVITWVEVNVLILLSMAALVVVFLLLAYSQWGGRRG